MLLDFADSNDDYNNNNNDDDDGAVRTEGWEESAGVIDCSTRSERTGNASFSTAEGDSPFYALSGLHSNSPEKSERLNGALDYFYLGLPKAAEMQRKNRAEIWKSHVGGANGANGATVQCPFSSSDVRCLPSWDWVDLLPRSREEGTHLSTWFDDASVAYESKIWSKFSEFVTDRTVSRKTKASAEAVLSCSFDSWMHANAWFCEFVSWTGSFPLRPTSRTLSKTGRSSKKAQVRGERGGTINACSVATKTTTTTTTIPSSIEKILTSEHVRAYNAKATEKERREEFLTNLWKSFFSADEDERISLPMPSSGPWTLFCGEGACESRLWAKASELGIGHTFVHLPQICASWHFNAAASKVGPLDKGTRYVLDREFGKSLKMKTVQTNSEHYRSVHENYKGGLIVMRYDPRRYRYEEEGSQVQGHLVQDLSARRGFRTATQWELCEVMLQPGIVFEVTGKRFIPQLETISTSDASKRGPTLLNLPVVELSIVGQMRPKKPVFKPVDRIGA